MAEPWDARRAGTDLLADVTAAIAAERAAAAVRGRIPMDVELARSVLRCPALQDATMAMLDALTTEYKPKIAAIIEADARKLVQAVEPVIRAQVAEEIALAIEQSPCPDCGHAHAATARRIGRRA